MHEQGVNLLPANGPSAIEWAVERMAQGGVIVFPTDTVYGLAGSLDHLESLERMFRIKGRVDAKPLPVLVSSAEAAQDLTGGLTEDQRLFLDRYWPGPLTVILATTTHLPGRVQAENGTVGLRSPNHPLALEIIQRTGGAIACTSANRSGQPPALTAGEAAAALGDEVDLILDGGPAPGGIASTVVAFIDDDLRIYREGPIALEHLQATWDELRAGRGQR